MASGATSIIKKHTVEEFFGELVAKSSCAFVKICSPIQASVKSFPQDIFVNIHGEAQADWVDIKN